jgi:mRNA interferase MazF
VSPLPYNARVGLALLCPITSRTKGYPFEVSIPSGLSVEGVVLSDEVRSLDWKARQAEFICRLPTDTTLEVLQKLGTLISSAAA